MPQRNIYLLRRAVARAKCKRSSVGFCHCAGQIGLLFDRLAFAQHSARGIGVDLQRHDVRIVCIGVQADGAFAQLRSGPIRPERRRSLRQRALPVLKLVALVLVALEAIYLLGANAFLSFGGLARAFESTNEINATFRRAWTVWPGQVHVRDLRITFQDHNLEWSLDMPRAKVSLRMMQLARRTFHATSVRGEGVVFRMRHRVQPEDAKRPYVAALPPIEEFETPAVFEARVPEPPSTPEQESKLWTIHVEDVDVGVSEVWAQQFRYLGTGRAGGAFELRAGRSVWVNPGSLELEPGRLLAGDVPVARISGRIACIVDYFDVDLPQGREVFRHISSELHLRGRDVRLDAATLFIDPSSSIRVSSGAGSFELDASVQHGMIEPASKLSLDNDQVLLERPPFALELTRPVLKLAAGPEERGEARLSTSSISLQHRSRSGVGATAGSPSVALESAGLDTAAEWSLRRVELDAPEVEVPNLSWFQAELPDELKLERGSARASLQLSGEPHGKGKGVKGGLEVAVKSARGRLGHTPLSADLEARLNLGALDFKGREARGEATVHIRNGALRAESQAIHGWWADVTLSSARLSAGHGLEGGGVFKARLRDGTPVLSMLAADDELPDWVPKVLPLNELQATGVVLHRCRVTEIRVVESTGGPLQASGRILSAKAGTSGALLLRLRSAAPLSAGLSLGSGGDGVSPFAGDDWLDEQLSRLDERARELVRPRCSR